MNDASEVLNQPSKVSLLASDDCIDLTPRAYSKIILHAAKYPHASVNGILLSKLPSKGQKSSSRLTLIDAIPLFHQVEGLSPMVEVALTQIESRATSVGMAIAGFYRASRHIHDNSVDIFSQRIADRIGDLSPSGRAALIIVDNKRLSLNLQSHALLAQMYISNADPNAANPGGKWKTIAAKNIRVEEVAFDVTSSLLQTRGYKDLIDFDNHLDDVSQDYLNVSVNMEIDKAAMAASTSAL